MQRYFDAIADYKRANGRKPKLILIAAAEFKRMAGPLKIPAPFAVAIDNVPAVGLEAITEGECVLLPLVTKSLPEDAPYLMLWPPRSSRKRHKRFKSL